MKTIGTEFFTEELTQHYIQDLLKHLIIQHEYEIPDEFIVTKINTKLVSYTIYHYTMHDLLKTLNDECKSFATMDYSETVSVILFYNAYISHFSTESLFIYQGIYLPINTKFFFSKPTHELTQKDVENVLLDSADVLFNTSDTTTKH